MPAKSSPFSAEEEALIAAADAAVAQLSTSYRQALEADATRLDAALAAAEAPDARDRNLADVFTIAHDMKGQAGSFGYDLLAQIAHGLCAQLRAAVPAGPRDVEIASVYARAIRFVVEKDLRGDGGAIGGKMLAELVQLSARTKAAAG